MACKCGAVMPNQEWWTEKIVAGASKLANSLLLECDCARELDLNRGQVQKIYPILRLDELYPDLQIVQKISSGEINPKPLVAAELRQLLYQARSGRCDQAKVAKGFATN